MHCYSWWTLKKENVENKNNEEIMNHIDKTLEPYDCTNEDYYEVMDEEPCDCIKNGKADPDCEECNGTGIIKDMYNPRGIYDWYIVGGRYYGRINGINGTKLDLYSIVSEDEITPFMEEMGIFNDFMNKTLIKIKHLGVYIMKNIQDNIAPVDELLALSDDELKKRIPSEINAMELDDNIDIDGFRNILSEYKGEYAVGIDYHL